MTTLTDTFEDNPSNDDIAALLRSTHTVALVGASANVQRPSNYVGHYLVSHGYRVIPVNPGLDSLFGERSFPDIAAIPADIEIDVVDVFRRSEHVPGIVDQAIARRVRAVWMQLGVVHAEAARRARAAGLIVVMDRCMKIDHGRLVET